jgi:hypothetical protein
MLKALLAILRVLRSAWLIELVGASLLVAAAFRAWGDSAALGAAGAFLVLKAYELESRGGA